MTTVLYPIARGFQLATLALVACLLSFAGTWTPMYVPGEYARAALVCLSVVLVIEVFLSIRRTETGRTTASTDPQPSD